MTRPIHSRHIAIVGGSGSGKTYLAGKLCAKLGARAARLSLDNFYLDRSSLNKSERDAVNFDDPAAIDWQSVRLVMDQLTRGEAAKVPVYDFATHTRRRSVTFAPRPLILWDGLWLLHHAPLRDQFSFSVFVGCGEGERLRRRRERDVRERGRSLESIQRQFAGQVQPMHERFVEPQRQQARYFVASPVAAGRLAALSSKLFDLAAQKSAYPEPPRTARPARPRRQPDLGTGPVASYI
jgi:uridine kinase